MTTAEIFGLSALLVGVCGFGARLAVEADVLDVLALVSICVGLGYLLGGVNV